MTEKTLTENPKSGLSYLFETTEQRERNEKIEHGIMDEYQKFSKCDFYDEETFEEFLEALLSCMIIMKTPYRHMACAKLLAKIKSSKAYRHEHLVYKLSLGLHLY